MTSLDTFRDVEAREDMECSECTTHAGCLVLWTSHETAGEPDHALCLHCLFDADGRYKHHTPARLLREHETIQSVDDRDDVVVVTATSPLGTVRYLHHTEPAFEQLDSSTEQHRQRVRIARSSELTGTAEAFAGEEFLAHESPYHDVARDYVRPDG